MSIIVDQLRYTVKDRVTGQSVTLLQNITCNIRCNAVTVIMGESGSGKTTLLDIMAGRKFDGYVSGHVTINEILCRPDIGYVDAADIHIGDFTVLENLIFAAKLRAANRYADNKNLIQLCENVAKEVSLDSCLHTLVGSELIKGISGGQSRRLSIAVALLSSPKLLFLDEPTRGLDSYTSLQLASTLKELAVTSKKTVVCTAHQPSAEILKEWEDLLLLSQGKLLYHGLISELPKFIETIPFEANDASGAKQQTIDSLIELTANESNAIRMIQHYELALGSVTWKRSSSAVATTNMLDVKNLKTISLFSIQNFQVLCHRRFKLFLRSYDGLVLSLLRNIIPGIFIGGVYYRTGKELEDEDNIVALRGGGLDSYAYNMLTLQFLCVMFIMFVNAVGIPSFFSSKRIYEREERDGLYSPWCFWLSGLIVELPLNLLGCALFSVILSEMSMLRGPPEWFYIGILLTSLAGMGQAQACAMCCSNFLIALVFFCVICSTEMIFSGFFVTIEEIVPFWRWMTDVVFTRWATQLLMYNEFNGNHGDQGDALLELYSFENTDVMKCCLIIVAHFLVLELIVLYGLYPSNPTLQMDNGSADGMVHKESLMSKSDSGYPRSSSGEEVRSHSVDTTVSTVLGRRSKAPSRATMDIESSLTERSSRLKDSQSFRMSSNSISSLTNLVLKPFDIKSKLRRLGRDNVFFVEPDMNWKNNTAELNLEKNQQAYLVFMNVGYQRTLGVGGSVKLLDNISCTVLPGEMCAIMGASGAGKTTLLDVLSGRANTGIRTGCIYLNGEEQNQVGLPRCKTSNVKAAYVLQQDAHNDALTVREVLTFAAYLRTKTSWMSSAADKAKVVTLVDHVARLLRLVSIMERIIGPPQSRNISAGQLRLLTIAVEIVNNPALIFLDEPTTGLDSRLALTVVKGIQKLASTGRTIMCTIHQPSLEVFTLFTTLLLLSNGKLVYFGPVNKATTHFESLFGLHNSYFNAADFVLHVSSTCNEGNSSEHTDVVVDVVRSAISPTTLQSPTLADYTFRAMDSASPIHKSLLLEYRSKIPPSTDGQVSSERGTKSSILQSLNVILTSIKRDLLSVMRRNFFESLAVRAAILGLIAGSVWYKIDDGMVLTITSYFFALNIVMTIWIVEAIPSLHEDRMVFYRERSADVVSSFEAWMSLGTTLYAGALWFCLICSIPVYYLAALRNTTLSFFVFYGASVLCMYVNIALLQFLAFATPNQVVHIVIYPGLLLPVQAIFSGYVVLESTMESWFSWGTYLDHYRWYMNALFSNEFHENSFHEGRGGISYSDISHFFRWETGVPLCFIYLLVIFVVMKLLHLFAIRFINYSSR